MPSPAIYAAARDLCAQKAFPDAEALAKGSAEIDAPERPCGAVFMKKFRAAPTPSSGFDRLLFLLLLHGSISVGWGITLLVFAIGVVPIAPRVSQYGQRHMALTNVFVAAVGTLATVHLKYTVRLATDEYARMCLAADLLLTTWEWLQGVASMGIFPPFQRDERKWTWGAWLLLFGSITALKRLLKRPKSTRC
ncbi:hypothetical protein C8R45DRAFT_1176807 [Mycena sanguinolenta]|nr:hypothetical protein C8R45DRAFT_1176807 [Mycena sanguinolenta]